MIDPKTMLVTLTVGQLAELIRTEVATALNAQSSLAKLPPAVLTSDEAAAYLKMPVEVLRKRARANEIPSLKIGSLVRFYVTDLKEYLERQRRHPGAHAPPAARQ